MLTRYNAIVRSIGIGVIVLGLVGCKATSAHDEQVNEANVRWKAVRSASMLHMAQQQFDAGDLEQAEQSIAGALAIDVSNARLHILAGRVALEQGHLERSYRRLAVAIELDPHIPAAHYYQGIVLQRWSRFEGALKSYQRAYDLEPDNVAYLLAVAETMVSLDQIQEAADLLVAKVVYFDQNAAIRVTAGHVATMLGDHEKAASYLAEAAMLRPDDTDIMGNLALAYLASGAMDEAIRTLENLRAQADLVDRRDTSLRLAGAYLQVGRIDDARAIYLEVTRSDPNDPHAWVKLGEVALESERYPEALTAARRARRLAADKVEGYLIEGLVWERRGVGDKALVMFERASELAPNSAAPLIMQGIIFQRTGRIDQAAAAYLEALRREPGHLRAKRLLSGLSGRDT